MISQTDRLQIDVYWPKDDGYGIPTEVNTLEQAAAVVERLKRAGYGRPDTHTPSMILVRRIRVDLIPLEELPKGEQEPRP